MGDWWIDMNNKKNNDTEEKRTVLIVDDTANDIVLLNDILCQEYKVKAAPNGQRALVLAQREPAPDLIVLDIMMPEMDGYEVCRLLKENQNTAGIPVIFISGLGESRNKLQAFKVGGLDYITKPFEDDEVLARVKLHLELSEMKQRLEDMVQRRTIKLEESNTALKVILQHRQTEREKAESNVVSYIDSLVMPHLNQLLETNQDSKQISLTETVKANLNEMTCRFSSKFESKKLRLTRREMEVASLIKGGKTNQEIAEFLCISEPAVSFHRQNLRKKLGLLGRKVNLVAYLNEIHLT